jgi:hypothetical protein
MVVEGRTPAPSCYENAYMLATLQKEGVAFVKGMVAASRFLRFCGPDSPVYWLVRSWYLR